MEERPPLTLRNALLHRWLLVLAIVGAFLLAAGLLSLRKPVYAASAAIYLDVSRTAPGFDEGVAAGELLQHDFIVASQSRPVLEAACASAGVACTPQELAAPESTLAKRISASSYRGTSTLLVMARAPTPDQAAALANAVAQAIIDQDKAEVVRLFKQPRDNLQKQLTDLQAAMAEEQQQLQHVPAGSPAAAAHQAQLTRLQGQYAVVFGRWQDLSEQQDRLTSVATVGQPALTMRSCGEANVPRNQVGVIKRSRARTRRTTVSTETMSLIGIPPVSSLISSQMKIGTWRGWALDQVATMFRQLSSFLQVLPESMVVM